MIRGSLTQKKTGEDHLYIPDSIFTFLESETCLYEFLSTLAQFPLDVTILQYFLMTQEKRFDLSERFQPCVGPRLEVKRCHDLLFELLEFPDWQVQIELLFQLWADYREPTWTVVQHWDVFHTLYHTICFPPNLSAWCHQYPIHFSLLHSSGEGAHP
ncbi:hypothetical protein WKT22_02202 [Candidatus Lokiarchaeum ossiferum]